MRRTDFDNFYPHRVRERCFRDGERVSVIGCVSPRPGDTGELVACPGDRSWALLVGDGTAQAATDEASNDALYGFAGAIAALLLGLAPLSVDRQPLTEALSRRAGKRKTRRALVVAAGVAAALPLAGLIVNICLRASHDHTSTYAYGRGGYVVAVLVAALLALFAWICWRRTTTLRAAIGPIASTPRSLLADTRASTVELSVRATEEVAAERIADGVGVVYLETVVKETYQDGKNARTVEHVRERVPKKLSVTDESGEGRPEMRLAVSDIDVLTTRDDARILARYPKLERHDRHKHYTVEERFIMPGEQLYILGEVVTLDMQASDRGYRSVRGAPTLGGQDGPLLVYAGSEAGLLEQIVAEGRRLSVLRTVALGALGLLAGVTAYLASM